MGGMSVASFSMADTCFGKLPLYHHQIAKGCCERVTKSWGLTLWRESPGIQIQGIPWTGGMAPIGGSSRAVITALCHISFHRRLPHTPLTSHQKRFVFSFCFCFDLFCSKWRLLQRSTTGKNTETKCLLGSP